MTAKQALLVFILGLAVGIALTYVGTSRQIAGLQHAAADSTTAAHQRDSAVTVYADSLAAVVDSLQLAKRPVTIKIAQDSAAARTAAEAVRRARTASDSNVALVAQVTSLTAEIVGLRSNAHADSLSLWDALARGNALQDSLHAQTRIIVDLNVRIQHLNEHRLPAWARVGFEATRTVLAVKGFVDVVRGR